MEMQNPPSKMPRINEEKKQNMQSKSSNANSDKINNKLSKV